MLTPDQITTRIASAFDRRIQDPIFGNIALNDDGTNPSDIPYTVPVKIEQQEETYYAYFSPFIDATKLANNTRVKMIYERDGYLTIIDADDVAARESYPNPPPRSFVLSQHNHSSPEQGGQLNASNVFNAGIVSQVYGGTGADLSASSVGSVFYQNAFGQFVAIPAVAVGNIFRAKGLNTAPAWEKLVLTTDVTGALPAVNGGTGQTVYAVGDLLYASTTTALSKLAVGSNGNVYQVSGGLPVSAALDLDTVNLSGTLGLNRGGTNADLSATGAGFLRQLTAGANVTNLKANFAATAAPAVSDDNTQGYGVGSLWLDTTNDNIYMAIDVSTGAAIWEQLNGAAGSSPFVQGTGEVYLDTPTDSVIIGDTGEDLGRFTIRGIADEPQLAIRFNGTQTQPGVLIQNAAVATVYSLSNGGDIYALGAIEIDGAFNHDGSTFGALNATPAAQQAQTVDIKDLLVTFGFMSSSGGATPLDTDEGLVTAFFQAEASTTSRASVNVPNATAAPSSPVEGDIWESGGLIGYTNGIAGFYHRLLFAQTNTVSNTNTSSELTLIGTGEGSTTFPANFFDTVGRTAIIRLFGNMGNTSGAQNLILRLKLAGSTVADTGTFSITLTGTTFWHCDIEITCRTTGGTGTLMINGSGQIGTVNIALGNTGTDTVDTTGTLAVDFTGQWSGTTNTARTTNVSIWAA